MLGKAYSHAENPGQGCTPGIFVGKADTRVRAEFHYWELSDEEDT